VLQELIPPGKAGRVALRFAVGATDAGRDLAGARLVLEVLSGDAAWRVTVQLAGRVGPGGVTYPRSVGIAVEPI
jgi:hypothetical protein